MECWKKREKKMALLNFINQTGPTISLRTRRGHQDDCIKMIATAPCLKFICNSKGRFVSLIRPFGKEWSGQISQNELGLKDTLRTPKITAIVINCSHLIGSAARQCKLLKGARTRHTSIHLASLSWHLCSVPGCSSLV